VDSAEGDGHPPGNRGSGGFGYRSSRASVGASSRVGDVVRAIAQRGTACWGDRVRRGRAAHGMESFARGDLAAEERSTLTSRSRPLP